MNEFTKLIQLRFNGAIRLAKVLGKNPKHVVEDSLIIETEGLSGELMELVLLALDTVEWELL